MQARWPQLRFAMFLVALLILLFVALPIETTTGRGETVTLKLVFSLTILAGIHAVRTHRTIAALAVAAAAPSLFLAWTGLGEQWDPVLAARRFLVVIWLLIVAVGIIGNIMRTRTVDVDTIAGGICSYVLLGAIWTYIYLALLAVDADAFRFAGTETTGQLGQQVSASLAYFSFVTLTTLGYGDIQPVSAVARSMATLEALTGQIFITVLIARLVGLHISRSRQ